MPLCLLSAEIHDRNKNIGLNHSWQLVFRNPADFTREIWLDFTWNPPNFMKSRMWAFAWWSSIGLSFERPIKRVVIETTGVWRHDVTTRRRSHYDITSFCDTHWSNLRFIGLFFPKRSGRIHRCPYRYQWTYLDILQWWMGGHHIDVSGF